jgi:hypothetical protein
MLVALLREANLEGQIAEALAKIERASGGALATGVKRMFKGAPEKEWRERVEAVVARLARRNRK